MAWWHGMIFPAFPVLRNDHNKGIMGFICIQSLLLQYQPPEYKKGIFFNPCFGTAAKHANIWPIKFLNSNYCHG